MKNGLYASAAAALVLLGVTLVRAEDAAKAQKLEWELEGTKFVGHLVRDPASSAKRPGVLVIPEWWGVNDYVKKRAAMLEGLGYVALVADLYGDGKVTTDPKQAGEWAGKVKGDRKVMRARALAALEQLKKVPQVDGDRLAAIGYCFGGTGALELARAGAPLKAVVSFHGGLDTPDPADAKNVKAKVLACNGADDTFVSEKELAGFADEMRKAGVDWQLVHYGGAVHSFTNPDAGTFGVKGVAYNEAADRRSWAAMRALFDEVFGE